MMPTPGYVPSGQFELGSSSYRKPHESVLQQPPQQKEEVDRQEEEVEVDEEEGQDEHDPLHQGLRQYQRDADGKIIIRPIGRGWTPASLAAEAIRCAIHAQFRGPHHCWTVTPTAVKDFWWARFSVSFVYLKH